MSAIIATLLSLLPRALLSIIAVFLTEKFVTKITALVILAGLKRLAAMTENKVDDLTVLEMRLTLEKAGVITPGQNDNAG